MSHTWECTFKNNHTDNKILISESSLWFITVKPIKHSQQVVWISVQFLKSSCFSHRFWGQPFQPCCYFFLKFCLEERCRKRQYLISNYWQKFWEHFRSFAYCDLIKKKDSNTLQNELWYDSSVISPMFHQLDRGRVQVINSVGNAWMLHLLQIHTWLKIGKGNDIYLIAKVTGIGQKEPGMKQNYVQTHWQLMLRRRYVKHLI